MSDNDFDVSKYTDNELFKLMDLDNPSDRELEAKIYMLLDKYENIEDKLGSKFYIFFQNVFEHFFSSDLSTPLSITTEPSDPPLSIIMDPQEPPLSPPEPQTTLITENKFTKGTLNPLLKETIKRIVSIDSQFRDTKLYPVSTEFTFNLSDTLVDVVSLKLYSVQIPYTWYTISNEFGSNFFYLKGNKPGINNGNYDYQLSIEPGNYQSDDFVSYITNSFKTDIIDVNPDVNFGKTGVSYNKLNSKLTTTIDIKSVYNETYYKLIFPEYDSDQSPSTVTSIPQLLGYQQNNYVPCSIFSNVRRTNVNNIFKMNENNNTINILLYQSTLSSSGATEYIPDSESYIRCIKIESTLVIGVNYHMNMIIADFQKQISINPYLNTNESSLEYLDGRFQLRIRLNRKMVENGENIKSLIYFQEDTSYNLWIGENSLFNFDKSYNELNNVLSEIPNLITTYVINDNCYITLENIDRYYCKIDEKIKLESGIYNSLEYIDEINRAFGNLGFIDTLSSIPKITCNFDKIIPFKNSDDENLDDYNFILDLTGSILKEISFPNTIKSQKTVAEHVFNTSFYGMTTENCTFTLQSIGNDNILIDDIVFSLLSEDETEKNFEFLGDLLEAFNIKFKEIGEIGIKNITFEGSGLTYSISPDGLATVTLNLDIKAKFKETDYRLFFSNDSWDSNLGFTVEKSHPFINYDESYVSCGETDYVTNLDIPIESTREFYNNLLYLTKDNNYFNIYPVTDPSGGVDYYVEDKENDPTFKYNNNVNNIQKRLTLATGFSYTKEQIFINLNEILTQDPITNGSFFNTESTFTKFRLNVNKIFTAQDYRLVFYDDTFTKCNFGFYSSIENVKWDTTLGWVLGYRNLTEYVLTDTFLSTKGKLSYYGDFINQLYKLNDNIVTITGDTSINVNLYNYVLIVLDDYCQNHLNDGLVTLTKPDNNVPLPSYANRGTYICNSDQYIIGNTGLGDTKQIYNNNNLTANQIYSANQILNTKKTYQSQSILSPGPFVQDIFGLVPIKTAGLSPGQSFVEFGGTLQNQERSYFGPVNIRKMSIQLLNDKGSILDLNNANWSFSFLVEQLYNPQR